MELIAINAGIVLMMAWGGTKFAMNGVHKQLDKHDAKLDELSVKVARIEQKVEDHC
jgi:hypothetical protein